jgi:hypothetical protein
MFKTFDRMTIDSAGAFLQGELERFDPTMNLPLTSQKWRRDIQLREDVSMADEHSSFSLTTGAATGGINPNGKNWVGKVSNAIPGVSIEIGKSIFPLYPWGSELSYTIFELLAAQQVGRPIDMQKMEFMKLKYEMDCDEQVYIGDSGYGVKGLINQASPGVSGNVANGASTHPDWARKTPAEILLDINTLLTAVWAKTGNATCPDKLLITPTAMGVIVGQDMGISGYRSVLEWLKANSLCNQENGRPLDIQSCKWCEAANSGLTYSRMVAYTNDKKYVRIPMVPMQRTPLEYRSLFQIFTYYAKIGVVEAVYPQTIGYADQI